MVCFKFGWNASEKWRSVFSNIALVILSNESIAMRFSGFANSLNAVLFPSKGMGYLISTKFCHFTFKIYQLSVTNLTFFSLSNPFIVGLVR